ncbi:hypothetical protein AA0120_g3566 [Alternaria tenuissima]|nr:hypothetical protein AA0120_g3566 [Alternaria tenuissima]
MSDKARQESRDDPSQIDGDNKPTSLFSLDEEADSMHGKEKEKNGDTPSSRAIEEHTRREEYNTPRSSLRSNVSSFAAPTKASEAKKNEKIELAQFVKKPSLGKELPGWTGRNIQSQTPSVPVSPRPSLNRHPTTGSPSPKNHDRISGTSSRMEKHRGTRSHSLVFGVSDEEEEEEDVGVRLEELPVIENEALEEASSKQRTQVEEEEVQKEKDPLIHEEEELEEIEPFIKKEPPKCHVEEHEVEFDVSLDQASPLTKNGTALPLEEVYVKDLEPQIEIPQDQVESMSQRSTEEDGTGAIAITAHNNDIALDKILAEQEKLQHELNQAETQRDEAIRQCGTVQADLETVKDDTKKLKHENDKLVTQLRESKDLIAARNAREPNLPALEAIEAENRRLRVTVDKKEKERSDANACCENLDDQLRDTQEKLKYQVMSIKELCQIVDLMSRSVSQGDDVPIPHPDALNERLAQASEIETLQIKITQLIGTFNEDVKKWQGKSRGLERQVADLESKIVEQKEFMVVQKEELLSPSLQSPLLSPEILSDRDEFKEYYQRERQKRKEVEQDLAKVEKVLSHLHPENEKLQSDFAKAQEELADLRPKADQLMRDANGWKEDSEEKKSQLEERTHAFETSTDQQRQETLRYIRDYYKKTNDEAYWEVEGLQKKLATVEEERIALERNFEQAKVENAHLADSVTRLLKRNKKRNADIGKIQEAVIYGEDFPDLSDEDEGSSSSSDSTISTPTHPIDLVRRRIPIPRCHLPKAFNVREGKISAYKEELQSMREQALFNASVKPPMSFKNRISVGRNDIMEKVREWKMGKSYPPKCSEWGELRRRSAWERWNGENWAKEFAQGNEVDILKRSGLWNEAWD